MERLLFFCFICGVLGLGETDCLRYFGGWTKKSNNFMEVFENHRVASCGGLEEERLKEVTGVQIPVVASQAWLGPEHGHSIALSNHTSSNNTLSPMPSSTVHSRDSQGSSVKGVQPPPNKPSDHQLSLADLETIKIIGKGNGGIVQLVQHKWTGQFFALKVVQMNSEESYRKLIAQEMRINQMVECPYVVPCYQSFYDKGVSSLILEYMDGGSLLDFLKRVKTIPEPYLAAICKQVPKGLLYLHHEKHIIHRDLKPSNLLINHRGEVKITDLGVSAIVESPTGMVNTFLGTYTNMCRELLEANITSKVTFGAWEYYFSSVQQASFPYSPSEHGEGWANFYELMEAIVEKPLPSAPADHFSQEFSSFISACVQKEPKDRQSARELMTHPFIAMYEDLDIDLSSYFTSAESPLATLENLSGISKS